MDHGSARLSTPGEYRTKLFLNRELSGTPQYAIWGSLLQCRPHAELYPLATDRQRKMGSMSVLLTSATSNPAVGCTASVKRKFHGMRILRPVYLYGSGQWSLSIATTLIILLDTWIFALNPSKSRRTCVQEDRVGRVSDPFEPVTANSTRYSSFASIAPRTGQLNQRVRQRDFETQTEPPQIDHYANHRWLARSYSCIS